jgi:Ca2+-binding EF-hand superfamily protein
MGAKWLGLTFPAAEMADLIAIFDDNGDGTITLQVQTGF